MSRCRDDRGASAVEYALILAAVAAVITLAVFLFGTQVHDLFSSTCQSLTTAGIAGSCDG
jgi:pilus assembly protein Flp/PilA